MGFWVFPLSFSGLFITFLFLVRVFSQPSTAKRCESISRLFYYSAIVIIWCWWKKCAACRLHPMDKWTHIHKQYRNQRHRRWIIIKKKMHDGKTFPSVFNFHFWLTVWLVCSNWVIVFFFAICVGWPVCWSIVCRIYSIDEDIRKNEKLCKHISFEGCTFAFAYQRTDLMALSSDGDWPLHRQAYV